MSSTTSPLSPLPLSAPPAESQLITHDSKTYTTIREGLAYILIPPNTSTSTDPKAKAKTPATSTKAASKNEGAESIRESNGLGSDVAQKVFYNPIQQFNRDLSVLAIKAFAEDFTAGKRRRKQRERGRRKGKRGEEMLVKEAEEGSVVVENVESVEGFENGAKRKREGEDEGAGEKMRKVGESGEGVKIRVEEGGDIESIEEEVAKTKQVDRETIAEGNATEKNAPGVQGDPNQSEEKAVTNGATQTPEWKPSFRILDALSATGLRALRYAAEIPEATAIVANDMDRKAVNSIRVNVEHNRLSKITPNTGNAIGHMYSMAHPSPDSHGPHHISGKYDVIDLDPYGTAAPFLDSAIQALNDGGLLCVTCTDSGVFASCGYPEKTFSLYGGMPVKGNHSHEGGLRIILQSIASTAAKYGIAIEPLLSLSIDFYVRMFVRIKKSPAEVKFFAGKSMLVYECDSGCGAWSTQYLGRNVKQTGNKDNTWWKHTISQAPNADRHCEHCGSKTHIAGPMWGGPIHNAAFVEKILENAEQADKDVYHTIPRVQGMLHTALDELIVVDHASEVWPKVKAEDGSEEITRTPAETLDLHPFFFIPSVLAKVIHCIAPSEAALKGALRKAGYRATRSHCKPGSIKTDAPWTAIWRIMREWVRQKQPIKEGAIKESSPGWKIMYGHGEETPGDGDTRHSETEKVESTGEGGKPPQDPERFKVVFDEVLGKDRAGKKLVRYQQNPRENWGPMARAKGSG